MLKMTQNYVRARKKLVSFCLRTLALRQLIRVPSIGLFQILSSVIKDRYIERNGFCLSNYGVWLRNNPSDRTFRLGLLGYRNKLDKFLRKESRKMIFFDIGSNQGVFTLVAASNPNFVEIHSFEPNIKIFRFLQENVIENEVDNVVFLHNKAISNVDGMIGFSMNMSHSGAGKIDSLSDGFKVLSINHKSLNEILDDTDLPVFIKVDVEGSEFEVLQEICKLEKFSNVKAIFVELNEALSNVEQIYEYMNRFGFTEMYKKESKSNCDGYFVRD